MKIFLTIFLITTTIFGQNLDTLWTKSFPAMSNGTSLKLCEDGGYIISFLNGIIKTDQNGNIQWQTEGANNFEAYKVEELYNGDYIVGGFRYGDALIVKLSNNGDYIWLNTFYDIFSTINNILVTSDNGFLISGYLNISGEAYPSGTLLKIDENGEFEWQIINEGYYYFESAYESNESFFVFGEKFSESYYTDVSVTQIDFQGNILNDDVFDFYDNDWPHSSIKLNTFGYVTMFSSYGSTGSTNGVMKILEGEIEWVFELEYFSHNIYETADGGFIFNEDEEGIIKTDSQFQFEWEFDFDFDSYPVQLIENLNGHYVVLTTFGNLISIGTESPTIEPINNIEINEDEPTSVEVIANGGDELTYSVESDTSSITVNMDGSFVSIGLEENWNGLGTVTVIVTNENDLSDTTLFEVNVLPVNDSPQSFLLIYPTINDTIQINTDSDETIMFTWEESVDVDSDVNYTTTVTLDYFGNNYSLTYESNEPSVEIAPYDWAVLMTNENIPRWTLEYVVEATDGEYTVDSEIGQFVFENTSLSIDSELIPSSFQLHQNYPNPFNPITTLRYELPEDGLVNITVYDMIGNVINQLVNEVQNSGYKSIQWDATNNKGQPVSAGVYLYTIETGEFRQTKKMILLK